MLTDLSAQVERTIVVEHFTNSRCGICANRNPAFYTNLDNHPGILHLSVHPSAPYSNCVLHQHNPSENDARTNYYNVYGGTPRLVIQGDVISAGANYGAATLFDPFEDQMSDVSISIYQTKADNLLSTDVVIKAVADNDYGSAHLLLAAVEELVEYNAPNGENEHRDVFRKTLDGGAQGLAVDIPAVAGDSIVISASTMADSEWVFEEMYVMAILQDAATKEVYQAGASDPSDNTPLTNTEEIVALTGLKIFPNPAQERLQISLQDENRSTVSLLDGQGRRLLQTVFQSQTELNIAALPAGLYWLEITTSQGTARQPVVIK